MKEFKELHFGTWDDRHDKDLTELNQLLSEGWVIDKIQCDGTDEYTIEAKLIFWMERENNNIDNGPICDPMEDEPPY